MRWLERIGQHLADRVLGWLDRIAEDGLLRLFWWRLRALFGRGLVDSKFVDGEYEIAVVQHSAILFVPPLLCGLLGLFLLVRWVPFLTANAAWFGLGVVLALLGYALFGSMWVSRDRFVITDSRVFRVWGLFSLHEAEMQIARLLDVTVVRPWWLRPFNSGHLVLENAAQKQGLRDIRYIPDPHDIARAIHAQRRRMDPRTAPRPDEAARHAVARHDRYRPLTARRPPR